MTTLDLLFPNFETLIRTPEDVARLNEAILQLAVQGKLVPQDPADEPASELLKRIRAEKRRLVKEGKIKEEDQLPRIAESEIPFELPNSWLWCRLGEVVNYGASGSNELQVVTDDTWVLDLEDIEKTTSRLLQRMRVRDREFKSSKNSFKKGDVLYGKLRPYLDKVIVADEDGVCTTEIVPIRVYLDITPQYLRFALKRPDFLEYVNGKTYGVKMPRLGTKDACMALFPLPPLAEQRRIVAKVESLFAQTRALEAKLRQAQADLVTVNRAALHRLSVAADADGFAAAWATVRDAFDLLYDDPRNVAELRQAILQLAVQGKLVPQDPADEPASELLKCIRAEKRRLVKEGKIKEEKLLPPIDSENAPFELPPGWAWVRFPDIGELARGQSKYRPRNDPMLFEGGRYPFVQTGAVARSVDTITTYSAMYNDLGLAQSRLWPKGTLCITIAANIGETGILGLNACFPDSVVGFLPFATLGHVEYFQYFLKVAKGRLEEFAPATAQKNINLGILASLLVPLPPLKELDRVVAKVDQLMRQCDALEAGLARAEGQRRALTAAALHGAFG